MKRREFVRLIESHGCVLLREGANHSLYLNPQTGRKEAIPRHQEIQKQLSRSICRNLGVPPPMGA
ncbi:MAG: type II toxin-antitoxin system HicA family toxin [Verrucomicrobiales bacterium]